jgi:hypothetical protein
LFEHGMDAVLGRQAIAAIEEMGDEPDGAYYRARLLDGLPPLLVSGLRRGLYGSSVRFEPLDRSASASRCGARTTRRAFPSTRSGRRASESFPL